MKLTPQERDSEVWRKLNAHIEERIALHRVKNDKDLDPVQTAKLRGRIQELIYLQSISKDDPPVVELDTFD